MLFVSFAGRKRATFHSGPLCHQARRRCDRGIRAAPDELARLGFALAHAIDEEAPEVPGKFRPTRRRLRAGSPPRSARLSRPLIVSGSSCRSTAVVKAAAQVAWALSKAGKPARLSFCFPECNSVGLGLMSPRPLSEAFRAVREGKANTVIILENDLFRRAANGEAAAFLKAAPHVVALDHLTNPTTASAELVFPAGTFAETDGTLVNYEGRAQRFFRVFVPGGQVRASWSGWARSLLGILLQRPAAGNTG